MKTLHPKGCGTFYATYVNYRREGDSWNEEELKVRFLAEVLRIAKPEEKDKIKTFLERNITAQYKDYTISVDVDLMMASTKGLNTPKKPYFFCKNSKKAKKLLMTLEHKCWLLCWLHKF